MNKGVYTVEAYDESMKYCGITIDEIIAFISARVKPNGYEYILHNRTEGKKPHYHIDFGWSKSLPELSTFLDVCDECNKKFRKRALTPSPDKPCEYILPLHVMDFRNPKNGKVVQEVHVIKGIKGRHKYLLHISDNAKKAGKEEYKEEELICSINWSEDKYKANYDTIRKQKSAEKREHDEEQHGDPFVYVYMLIAELNICNLPQLLNLIISSEEHRWCLPYVKNDLLKYNAIIRDFAALHRKEYIEASMRADKSNNTDCCRNIEIKQALQEEPETYQVDNNPFEEEEPFFEEPSKELIQNIFEGEELPPIEFVDTLDGNE